MKSGIYKITNNLNNHFYIGQSRNINKRWREHKKSAKTERINYTVLQRAFHKYGIENFSFEIIEECPIDKLDEKEIFYIAELKPNYNMNLGGSGNTGYKVTDETKKILKKLGKEQWNSYDEETKNRIIRNQLIGPRKGSHRSEETKKLLSEKTKDYFLRNNGMSKEQKEKISNALKGRVNPNYSHYQPVEGICNNIKVYFGSVKYASIILDINYSAICHCLREDRKSAGGFSWKYCSQETIQKWSREKLILSRSAVHPNKDEDIVHAVAKDESYREHDKGLIALARRSNTIKTICAEPVYENDIFDVQLGVGRTISHKMNLMSDRGQIIGYYCLVELNNGGIQFCVKSKKDIEKHRDKFSKSYNAKDPENIWNKNFDAMALKTCVIQALKLCPISIEALDAVAKEEYSDTRLDDTEYTVVDYNEVEVKEADIVTEQKEQPAPIQPQLVQNVVQPQPIPVQTQPIQSVPVQQQKPQFNQNLFSSQEEELADKAFEAIDSFNGDIF